MKILYELDDNRYLCLKIIEIESLPDLLTNDKLKNGGSEKIIKFFQQLLSEMYQLGGLQLTYELLWLTEAVENQPIQSKIHLYIVFRMIGDTADTLERELNYFADNVCTSLHNQQFNNKVIEPSDDVFNNLINRVNDSTLFSVVKKEKYSMNSHSPYPYYYGEVISGGNTDNFSNIVASMSQCKNCCISFQLIPTVFSKQERYILSELSTELSQIASGIMRQGQVLRDSAAEEPAKVYQYYSTYQDSPLFLYNIMVLGDRSTCANLATKVMSLLQNGTNSVCHSEYMCIDLSNEKMHFADSLPNYIWNINALLLYKYRNQQIRQMIPLANTMNRMPYIVTIDEAVSFFRLPQFEDGMIALQSTRAEQATERFADKVIAKDNIKMGSVPTGNHDEIIIGCPEKAFTKHALIVGTPGSGKTTFSIHLLLQFAKRGIPFLAIEPTKTEYRAMIDAIDDLQIFTPGNSEVAPFIINPFIPPKDIQIEQYIPSLASAFKAAFSMPSPLDMIFLKAIRSCYIKYGWKDYSKYGDSDVTVFGLYEFILEFKKMIKETNYSKEVRGNLESAGLLRLTNLIEQNSNIYDSIHTVPLKDILSKPTVLELNAIDNAEQKSLIMALLLINICLYTKKNHIGDGELKNAILIDEAHVLLSGNGGSNTVQGENGFSTVKALQDMIAEIRSYGTSIIIADQSPTKVSREIVANTDIKVSFRLVQSTEKTLIADSSNMDEYAENHLATLKPGEAYLYYSQLEKPQLIITEDIREKEKIRLSVSNQEIYKRMSYWKKHGELLKPYMECKKCKGCLDGCDFRLRSDAEYIANRIFTQYRHNIQSKADAKKLIFFLGNLSEKEFSQYDEKEKIIICTRIKLLRKLCMECSYDFTNKEKDTLLYSFFNENGGDHNG